MVEGKHIYLYYTLVHQNNKAQALHIQSVPSVGRFTESVSTESFYRKLQLFYLILFESSRDFFIDHLVLKYRDSR